ncbi:hypothetical protein ZTR_10165 [Talaromyces verruculosus]|nr:hypothetical protein ZTR_10165 [Talaromyces verruculosus]
MYGNTSTSSVVSRFTCGSISYHIRDRVEYLLSDVEIPHPGTPAVVMHLGDKDLITVPFVQNTLERFAKTDDAFTLEFAKSAVLILLYEGSQPPRPGDAFLDNLSPYSCSNCIYQKSNPAEKWLEGSYFLQGKELRQCWRLYPDHLSAFTITTIPDDQNDHRVVPLGVTSDDGADLAVAVLSRLYIPQDANKPLNGLRVSVKDNYHLAGTVTTLGNRSYGKYYGVQNLTSAYVERLIVAKPNYRHLQELSSLRNDRSTTFPRLVREQIYTKAPSGSSIGAGCAIVGYGWMDLALGTDTTGSTRAPAASNGVWALRPTWGTLSMEGIVPSVEEFDTVGLMARDVEILHNLYKVTGPEKSLKEKTIMVVPYGSPEPKYRDEAPPAGGNSGPSSYNPNFFATILGLPKVIVPVGQIPFVFKVTKRTEYLPAVAGLIGEKGMDEILLQLSKDALAKAGCPTKDFPGRLAFNTDDEMLVASAGGTEHENSESVKL